MDKNVFRGNNLSCALHTLLVSLPSSISFAPRPFGESKHNLQQSTTQHVDKTTDAGRAFLEVLSFFTV